MQFRKKEAVSNGIHEGFPSATNTILRITAGSCTVKAVWHDNPDTFGQTETLEAGDPIHITTRCDSIEIAGLSGGTVIIEGHNT